MNNKRYLGSMSMLLVLFALIGNAVAGKIVYSAKYKNGLGGNPAFTQRLGALSDAHELLVVQHISEWSEGKYKAVENARHNLVTVSPVALVDNKAQASAEVQAMVNLVCLKTQECAPTTPAK